MKINWKVRLRNKTWLASVIALVVSFAYDLLAMVEYVPPLSQDWLMSLIQTTICLLHYQQSWCCEKYCRLMSIP